MSRDRFQPSRAGIINLWDYRDEEFVFVDGWLALRGPNGSGKTKALEVLFPFVLDGRIEPRRLNPFASEERTMKSNVLYRGQELSHAYVWMEFSRRPEGAKAAEFVTIGIGLRAHRHQDRVTRWHFVVDGGRVGEDFSLIDADDRPLARRDLIAELGADRVLDGVDEYRRAVDARLFGLGLARYEQLLDLVLTLRKPQLAKDLNPAVLSRTLQRGLRPLDEALIAEAAGSFDDMEAVARTLESLVAAETATTTFLSVYSTYLRTHARAAADSVTARRAAVAEAREALTGSVAAQAVAQAAFDQVQAELATTEGEPVRLRAHLSSLQASAAYRSHQELENLRHHVEDLRLAVARAQRSATERQSIVDSRAAELAEAEEASRDAERSLHRLLTELAGEAEEAGIVWAAEDGEPDGFVERLRGRAEARHDDIGAVRAQVECIERANREHVRAELEAAAARDAVSGAESAHVDAVGRLDAARDSLREELRTWGARHGSVLSALPAPDAVPAMIGAVDGIGTGATLSEILSEHAAAGLSRVQREVAATEVDCSTVDQRRSELVAERDRIAAARADAPMPLAARPADRSARSGAPLWRLVDFARSVKPAEAAGIEAALEAAGLLDAWVHPDPAQSAAALRDSEQDGYLVALAPKDRPSGRTLADLLVAETQADVSADVVTAVLASIAVHKQIAPATPGPTAVTTSGHFSHGVVIGGFTKPAPEYVGATARARRRAARIAECDRLITELDEGLAVLDERLDSLRALLTALAVARASLPGARGVTTALREAEQTATTLRVRREHEAAALSALDQAVVERSAAAAALRRVTGERSLPAERVEAVAGALRRFEAAGLQVEPARRAARTAATATDAGRRRHGEAAAGLADAREAVRVAAVRHEEKHESYETLAGAVGDVDVQRVVREVAQTEKAVEAAEVHLRGLRERLIAANGSVQRAQATVESGRTALRLAGRESADEALRLRPFAHADLLSLLRCPVDLRWPAHTPRDETGDDQEVDDELAPETLALHDAILGATRELTPSENSLKQSATRAGGAFNELQVQLASLEHRPELDTDDGLIVVRIADEQGLTPVASFAERIARERADQEQLLSEAERRVFEDALLTQLARQIHHRTIEARDLVQDMDKQMRSRRMSSGLTVGVGWQLADDLDPQVREITRLLEKDPARLGPTQLATLRGHFAARIKAARGMSPEQPYRELLAQALDYRMWRVFAFTLQRPGSAAESLTRSRHSQLSGGEQSVSLHLPLFAAANALFGSANPTAPRLLGMDEAFAGVDENGRGELMALAVQFDLDLFMTGFDLWATHPVVPGCAHYDLTHSAVEHTVAAVLIVWNGTMPTADFDGTLARALGSPATRRAPARAAVAASASLLDAEPNEYDVE